MIDKRISFGQKLGLSRGHAAVLARRNSPHKIQDYLDTLRINDELDGDTCLSVTAVLNQKHAHCIEASFVAACALWMQGQPPLIMDLKAHKDYDHVVAVFRYKGCWGAISKSNHVWLRWRDPVYRSLRELAMSYFHEYTRDQRKTLRGYSVPLNLMRYDPKMWVTNSDNCWQVAADLDDVRHYSLITPAQARLLRPRDRMEIKVGRLREYPL